MGIIQKPDTERNLALIRDYLLQENGKWVYSIAQLGIKYARVEDDEIYPLTSVRIHQILNKNNVTKQRRPVGVSKKKPVKSA